MSQLLVFPPTILGFLGSVILILLTTNAWHKAHTSEASNHHAFLHTLNVLALLISFIWIITIYPSEKYVLLSGHFSWNPLTALLSLSLVGVSLFVFICLKDLLQPSLLASDYQVLVLLSLFGGLVMLTAGSTIVFYLGLEILSLPLYGLVALDAKDTLQLEAAIKYIVMGMLASILLLYGFCVLYAIEPQLSLNTLTGTADQPKTLLTQVGIVFLLSAFLFKLGAMPFHFWVPDVYQGASLAASLVVSTIAKFAAIGMGLRLFIPYVFSNNLYFHYLLLALGLVSILGANLIALKQTHIRRLVAYSSIAHMGSILLGFALSPADYSIVLLYGISYSLMTATLFGVLAHLSKIGMAIHAIEDLHGLNQRHPTAALVILVVTLSMAGIPPSIGFFSKFGLLQLLIRQGLYVVGGLALVATTIGTYYYLNIIKCMYFTMEPISKPGVSNARNDYSQLALLASGLILFGLALFPSPLINLVVHSVTQVIPQDLHHT